MILSSRILFLIATSLILPSANAADLTVGVDGVKSANGSVTLALYSSASTFLKLPAGNASIRAVAGSTTLVVRDLAPGDYAFAVYHDANADGKLDRNFLGIPTEDYAFSNDAAGNMGPPSFVLAKLTVGANGLSTRVELK